MPVPLPNLDDRQFADLVDEVRAQITHYAPEWTNHNIADPGIMLLELFAWLTEVTIYRINRVPDNSRIRFLQMLGALFEPAQPATLTLQLSAPKIDGTWTLPGGTFLTTSPYAEEGALVFETLRDATLTAEVPTSFVIARQTSRVQKEPLGISSGKNFQLFELAQSSIVLPDTPFPIQPEVHVGGEQWTCGEQWTYRANFTGSQCDDKHFTIKTWMNAVAFGDGEHGLIPPEGARITVTYRHAPTLKGTIHKECVGKSRGTARQYFRLKEKLLPLDLQPRSPLEPVVKVIAEEMGKSEQWQYRSSILEMHKNAKEFTVEPARNGVRFGNGVHGKVLPSGAEVFVEYRYTVRPIRTIAPGTPLYIVKPPTDCLKSLVIAAGKIISPGKDAIDLDKAHEKALAILKPNWRAITTGDFETMVKNSDFDIARAQCLPGRNVDTVDAYIHHRQEPGHVSLLVVPRAKHVLPLNQSELVKVLGISPDGTCIVGLDSKNVGWLWTLESQSTPKCLGNFKQAQVRQVTFSSTAKRLLARGYDNIPRLYDTHSGDELQKLPTGATVQFSHTGGYFVDKTEAEAYLRDAQGGAVITRLWQNEPVKMYVFGRDDSLLATVGTVGTDDFVQIWDTAGGVRLKTLALRSKSVDDLVKELNSGRVSPELRDELKRNNVALPSDVSVKVCLKGKQWVLSHADKTYMIELEQKILHIRSVFAHPSRVITMTFSDDGECLTTATADGQIRLWWTRSGQLRAMLPQGRPISELFLDRVASRLVAYDGDQAWLWSTRSRRQIAHLGFKIKAIRFSPDGSWLAVSYNDFVMRLWDAKRGGVNEVGSFNHGAPIHDLAFSPSSQRLITLCKLSGEYTVRLWDLRNVPDEFWLECIKTSSAVTLDKNGIWFCLIERNLLQLWSIEEKKLLSTMYHDDKYGPIQSVHDKPYGKYLYVVSKNSDDKESTQTVQIWNAEHVLDVRRLVNERRLVTSQHHVAGPTYTNIFIRAAIAPGQPPKPQQQLQKEIAGALLAFFHPLHGGPDGQGWPWGRNVYASEVYQILENVEGVDHVESLTLTTSPETASPVEQGGKRVIDIPSFHLVNYVFCPEAIAVTGQESLRPQNITFRT